MVEKIDKIRKALLRYVEADASGKPKYGKAAELARISNVDLSTLSKLLKKGTPTSDTLLKLAPYITKELNEEGLSIAETGGSYDANKTDTSIPASELPFVKRYQRMSPRRPLEAVIMDKLPELSEEGLEAIYDFVRDRIKSEKQNAENPQGEGK